MTDSNLVRLAYIDEGASWGTTPTTPQLRSVRYTSQNITFEQNKIASAEKVGDRMTRDLIAVGARNAGGYNFELSFKEHDEIAIGNALKSSWVNTPEKENATADSSITDAGTTVDTYTIDAGGAAFVVGHLVRASGFDPVTANNKVFRVASSTATTVVGSGLSLTAQAAPPAGARLKVVGFQGATGDITATATGLGSTLLDFTTLGIPLGGWVKIGGTAAGDRFNTTALNDWARVTAKTATALTLDNLPTGWTTDAGTGKTIKVWFGDQISNGTTQRSVTIEKGYMGQATPLYLVYRGMSANELTLTIAPGRPIEGTVNFIGKDAATATTTPLDATLTPSYSYDVMNATYNIGRIAEGGSVVTAPSYVQQVTISINNNIYDKTAVQFYGLVGAGLGPLEVTGRFVTYFEDATQYNKIINNTSTSITLVCVSSGAYYVFQIPRAKLAGNPTDQDQVVVMDTTYTALKDTGITGKAIVIDRGEYSE